MPSLNAVLIRTNGCHFSGSASSGKIASTGHSGSQAPQSMHSSTSITSMRSPMWMQSTGQTSMHDLSLMSMQGSPMMYVIANYSTGVRRPSITSLAPSKQSRLREHAVEAGGVRATQSSGVRVIREPEQRHVGIGVGDLVRIDAGDVRDHQIGRLDPVGRLEAMLWKERLELPAEENLDPTQQDRRHAW